MCVGGGGGGNGEECSRMRDYSGIYLMLNCLLQFLYLPGIFSLPLCSAQVNFCFFCVRLFFKIHHVLQATHCTAEKQNEH